MPAADPHQGDTLNGSLIRILVTLGHASQNSNTCDVISNMISGSCRKQPTAMLAIYTIKCVTPGANLRECMPLPSVNKATHSSFETQRNKGYQKSKTGVSVA